MPLANSTVSAAIFFEQYQGAVWKQVRKQSAGELVRVEKMEKIGEKEFLKC